jgi:hypothetical protein
MTVIIEGAVIALAGVAVGRFLPNRRKGPKPPQPVCGCTHHHGFHDPQTGECHGVVRGEPIEFDAYAARNPVAWAQVQCSCRQYSGPVPIPEFYAPEITGDTSA